MKSYKDRGIIIKIRQLAEADRLVVIYGEKFGRIEAVAKGVSKLLSRKRGSIDLLNYAEFALHSTRGLDIITEASLLDDFAALKQDLYSVSQIFYILELLDKLLISSESEDTVSALLLEFLPLLQDENTRRDFLISAFEVKLLNLLGFGPILDSCLHCGKEHLPNEKRIAAASGQAGYLCDKHFAGDRYQNLFVPDTMLKLQRFMLVEGLQSLRQIRYDQLLLKRLKSIQRTWIEGVIEKNLKSTAFLDKLDVRYNKYREI